MGETTEHDVDHGPADHRHRAGRPRLIVARKAPVEHEGAQGLLDHPPFGFRRKPSGSGLALDDLHVDAQAGAVVSDGVLEPCVHPRLGHRGRGGGDLVQQRDADRVVVDTGRDNDDVDEQAQDVSGDAPFAAGALLPRIQPGRLLGHVRGGAHGLGVQNDGGGVLAPLAALADLPRSRLWTVSVVPSSRHLAK